MDRERHPTQRAAGRAAMSGRRRMTGDTAAPPVTAARRAAVTAAGRATVTGVMA